MEPLEVSWTTTSLQPATADQWLAIKPIFMRLYIDDNKKLVDVIRELAEKHGFRATTKAFKRRITQWQAFKNYKAAEKEDISRQRSNPERPYVCSEYEIRGRPVKLHRIRRHERAQALKQTKDKHMISALIDSSSSLRVSNALPTSLADSNTTMLLVARNFYRWITSEAYQKAENSRYALNHCLVNLAMAVSIVSQRMPSRMLSQSWLAIHHACQSLPKLITVGSGEIIIRFMTTMQAHGYMQGQAVPQIRTSILKYIWGLCLHRLAEGNPLKQLLKCLKTKDSIIALERSAGKLYYDAVCLPALELGENIDLKLLYGYACSKQGAMGLGINAVDGILNRSNISVETRLGCLEIKGLMSKQSGDYKLALMQLEELLSYRLESNDPGELANCYRDMKICYGQLGDAVRYIKYSILTFQTCLDAFGSSDIFVRQYFAELVNDLQCLEQWDELRKVEEEYWFMYEDDGDILHQIEEEDLGDMEIEDASMDDPQYRTPFDDLVPDYGNINQMVVD